MDKDVLNYVAAKTRELIDAPTCSAETKASAQAWLAAVGTEQEASETRKYVAELEADIMPIDQLIGFAGSDAGKAYFGEDMAKNVFAHAEAIKAAGATHCDCPACAVVAEILAKKNLML